MRFQTKLILFISLLVLVVTGLLGLSFRYMITSALYEIPAGIVTAIIGAPYFLYFCYGNASKKATGRGYISTCTPMR
ncbi:ABC-type Fe3+-siderophore transport system permease subunit [Paenibacillus sp. RC254]